MLTNTLTKEEKLARAKSLLEGSGEASVTGAVIKAEMSDEDKKLMEMADTTSKTVTVTECNHTLRGQLNGDKRTISAKRTYLKFKETKGGFNIFSTSTDNYVQFSSKLRVADGFYTIYTEQKGPYLDVVIKW